MKVGVIGAGYVGLVNAAGLAASGHDVVCVERDPAITRALSDGRPHIAEKGLPELLARAKGNLRFAAPSAEVLAESEVILVCVGTPNRAGQPDLSALRSAMDLCAAVSRARGVTVVIRSTVLPGTTDGFIADTGLALAMAPEFLREGFAVEDFLNPDRIVIGTHAPATLARCRELFGLTAAPVVAVNPRTAELIKYVSNSLLAVQISAANEFASLAETLPDVDAMDVMNGVFLDRRWQGAGITSYLTPGLGFGGGCLPKDVEALRSLTTQATPLLGAVEETNTRRPGHLARAIETLVGNLQGKRILFLGLSFKEGTDDLRNSPAIELYDLLAARGAALTAHDPMLADDGKFPLVHDWRSQALRADAVVLATPWAEYRDLENLALENVTVIDCRRLCRRSAFRTNRYWGPGMALPAAQNPAVPSRSPKGPTEAG